MVKAKASDKKVRRSRVQRREFTPAENAALAECLAAVDFHKSPGYIRKADGVFITPHEHTTIFRSPEAFKLAAAAIRESSAVIVAEYKGREYRYLEVGAYRYWTMFPVLNRVKIDDIE